MLMEVNAVEQRLDAQRAHFDTTLGPERGTFVRIGSSNRRLMTCFERNDPLPNRYQIVLTS